MPLQGTQEIAVPFLLLEGKKVSANVLGGKKQNRLLRNLNGERMP